MGASLVLQTSTRVNLVKPVVRPMRARAAFLLDLSIWGLAECAVVCPTDPSMGEGHRDKRQGRIVARRGGGAKFVVICVHIGSRSW